MTSEKQTLNFVVAFKKNLNTISFSHQNQKLFFLNDLFKKKKKMKKEILWHYFVFTFTVVS